MNTNYYYFCTVKPIMSEFTIKYFTHYTASCITIVTIISLSGINSRSAQSSIFGGTQGVSYVLHVIFANLLSGNVYSVPRAIKLQHSCHACVVFAMEVKNLSTFETRSCSTLKRPSSSESTFIFG